MSCVNGRDVVYVELLEGTSARGKTPVLHLECTLIIEDARKSVCPMSELSRPGHLEVDSVEAKRFCGRSNGY
jgi:hypothetical protein